MFQSSIGEGLQPLQQIHDATSMIGFAGPPPRFFGSCFFVAKTPWSNVFIENDRAVMFLVTAAHVVRPALFEGRDLCVRIPRYQAEPLDTPLPHEGWVFAETGADVAILPMPELKHQYTVGGVSVPAISFQQLLVDDWQLARFDFRFGDRVHIVGLWYGSTEHPQLIVRSGNIATATVGPVQTDSGAVPTYLVDASVTRGMSGGPVFATNGTGWAQTAIIGVNHGYWPIQSAELDEAGDGREETADEAAHRRLLSAVEQLNSRLCVVVPIHYVAEILNSHPSW